ncbi:sulfatase family protein [Maribellus mangrovi]|uniref:sulfatase family protein n=1 Tax=Maribellus mangrovi TaxID=3133146 RepID=UPI0030EB2605
MKTRLFLYLLLALGLQVKTEARPQIQNKEKNVPVIIIMADQLRYDAIGKFTPNINSLKEEGVTFNRLYTACPLCAPSRASFFTGRYPNNTGCIINGWQPEDRHYQKVRSGMPDLYRTMSEDWDSWHIGKQHFFTQDKIDKDPQTKTKWITTNNYEKWLKKQNVRKAGGSNFKAIDPELVANTHTSIKNYSIPETGLYEPGAKYYFDQYVADKVVETIKGHSEGSKPLLVNAMFLAPHPPLDVPEPYYSEVKKDDFTLPDNVGVWYPGQSPLQLYNLTGFFGSRYSREQWSEIWPKYLGLVSLFDDEVGRIIQALKDKGIYDNALIIVTADHGEMLGSHCLWQKNCMYEESARVPFVIKFPSDFKPAVNETDEVVSLMDVWPTLIDYLKIPDAAETDGISFMPVVNGKTIDRKPVFIQYDGNGAYGNNQRCIVQDDFKLILDTFKDEIFVELYNIRKDPEEKDNLAFQPEYKYKVNELINQIKDHMENTHDLIHIPDNVYDHFLANYQPYYKK